MTFKIVILTFDIDLCYSLDLWTELIFDTLGFNKFLNSTNLVIISSTEAGADPENVSRGVQPWRITMEVHKYEK